MFSKRVLKFYASLDLKLPPTLGVELLHPYSSSAVVQVLRDFFGMYYSDERARVGIFGINPGRFGGGKTGLSFTDPVALREHCGVQNDFGDRKELSSDFVYKSITAFGGAKPFFSNFFLSALCPLGFTRGTVNCNFYDDPELLRITKPFIIDCLQTSLTFPLRRDVAICFGTGTLRTIFKGINAELALFNQVHYLEHPRFIMQYRRKELDYYINKYCETFSSCLN